MARKIVCAAAAACLVLATSGCSIFSSDNPRDPVKLAKIQETAGVSTVWSDRLGGSRLSFLTPAIAPNGIYAAGGKSLYRIDPASGAKVWTFSLKEEITSGVGSDGYFAAVGTTGGQVVVADSEGKEVWRAKLPSEVDRPPLVGHDLVIVHTADTRITAFNAKTGSQVWHYQGQIPALSLRTPREMAFFADGILVGQANGKLAGLSLAGKPAFEAAISLPSGITEVERLNDVVGAPLIASGLLCASTYQGRLTCMSAQNGTTRWSVKVDAVTGPTSDGRAAFVVDAKGVIHAYSLTNGAELWKNDTMRYRANTAPVALGGYLACGDYDGYIHLFDPATGRETGRGRIFGAVRVTPQQLGDGALFQTEDGTLALLRASGR